MSNTPVQCTRCRNKHTMSERIDKPDSVIGGMTHSVCPRCECRTYYNLSPQVAWCWATGLIEIGDALPAANENGGGVIHIASGPKSELEAKISAFARHGKGERQGWLIVPGVPEAGVNSIAALRAVQEWTDWCSKCLERSNIIYKKKSNVVFIKYKAIV